jgi:hypothetical protein
VLLRSGLCRSMGRGQGLPKRAEGQQPLTRPAVEPECLNDQRMAITADVERLLLARSGGFCANPTCRGDLFPDIESGQVATLKELAHIIAQSPKGPRGEDQLPETERDTYDNIVLLCPSCHALVDKMKLAEIYDAELLREWKREQERRIEEAVNVPRLGSRDELIERVRGLLRDNKAWWEQYGPESPAAEHPLSEASETWLRGVRRTLIPNNWQVIHLVERNADYLNEHELEIVSRFKVHAEAFANRHLAGELDPYAPRYPVEMDDVFGAGAHDG